MRDRANLAATRLSLGLGLLRFGLGLPAFVRGRITLADAERAIREGVRTRAARLLELFERAVFPYPRSPYHRLLREAGCEPGDVRELVRREGVEGALRRLHECGVYVSYEEFKGGVPAVRGSRAFAFRDTDFDNPLVTPHLPSRTGGSGWKPSRIVIDLELIAQMAPHWAIWFAAHRVLGEPLVFVNPYYPAAVTHQLMCARFGNRFVKWFSTAGGGSPGYRLVSAWVHGMVRRAGGFPKPEPVLAGDLSPVAEYLAGLVARGSRPAVNTSTSLAARVSLAAAERGIPLGGVTFMGGAEPLTPSRKTTIEASGAKATVTYGFSEAGNVGSQCAAPRAVDDIHVCLDVFAAIQRPRPLADGSVVDALLLTSLRTASPKVLLNAEIGDHAVLETGPCGCPFDGLGYTQHLHTIRSFGKLTGDGVTFIGSDVLHVLESVLPRRFGGDVTDYQLVEEETRQGLPRYVLLVNPDLGTIDEPAVTATFIGELSRLRRPYPFMADQWARVGALRVVRSRPEPGPRGKIPAFRTLGSPLRAPRPK